MIQYGLRNAAGKWLPRDAFKRGQCGVRLDAPDLWQDRARAETYASQYSCELVEFNVATYVDRDGKLQPGHGKGL